MPQLDLVLETIPDAIISSGKQAFVSTLESQPLPSLDGASENALAVKPIIEQLATDYQGGLVESGLWLLAGELDRSHSISQSLESAEGSFWHGIMHRREGDFSNAKYWFRRVGAHPVHAQLAEVLERQADSLSGEVHELAELSNAASLPTALVDSCQRAAGDRSAYSRCIQQICWWEWQLLFAHCL